MTWPCEYINNPEWWPPRQLSTAHNCISLVAHFLSAFSCHCYQWVKFFFSRPSTETERKKRQKENAVGFLPVPQVCPTTYANVRPKPRKKPGADAPAYLYWDDRLANSPLIRDSIEKTSHTHCKTHTHTHTQAVGCCCCCCCSLRMCNRPSVASVQRRCSTAI